VSQDYDFAIIEFSEPVDLLATSEPKVTPVCLPPRQTRDTYVGVIGTASGIIILLIHKHFASSSPYS
jgi:hypothetical protein